MKINLSLIFLSLFFISNLTSEVPTLDFAQTSKIFLDIECNSEAPLDLKAKRGSVGVAGELHVGVVPLHLIPLLKNKTVLYTLENLNQVAYNQRTFQNNYSGLSPPIS